MWLILPVPIPDKERKWTLIFTFRLLCGASKGYMKTSSWIISGYFCYRITVVKTQSWIGFWNWILAPVSFLENFVQQQKFNSNRPTVIKLFIIMLWILHIVCICPSSWLKMFLLFKLLDLQLFPGPAGRLTAPAFP